MFMVLVYLPSYSYVHINYVSMQLYNSTLPLVLRSMLQKSVLRLGHDAGSHLDLIHRVLLIIHTNLGQSLQSLLYLQECEAKAEGIYNHL